ncbi:recombinase family protein [Neisseriaceae bacterium CLB008]
MQVKTYRYGYARISTQDQTLNLQQDALMKAGCDQLFTEIASGKNAQRKVLNQCLNSLKPGDTLVVWRLDRLGRSVRDLVNIIGELEKNQINFESLTEKIDTHSNTGKLIFHVFAALAEFERNLIRERTFAGLAAAKARGRVGGRRPKLSPAEIHTLLRDIQAQKTSITQLAKQYNVSRTTVYSIIKQHHPDTL